MKNLFKWPALVAATLLILIALFVWFVASGSDEATVYKENDFFNYHMLTDPDIEKAPRITDNYYFESHPGNGYSPSNSIVFKRATDTASLSAYLKKLGYAKQNAVWVRRRYGQSLVSWMGNCFICTLTLLTVRLS